VIEGVRNELKLWEGEVFIGWWGTKFENFRIFFGFFGVLTVKND
jgi:hypothetical protein